jgi:peptidoglycan/xylan/chitin deacetylase (PgdA/CDA1 family)
VSATAALKRAAAWALLRSHAVAAGPAVWQRGTAIILMYHRVNEGGDPFFPALPSADFERQVELLSRRYRVESFEEVAAWLRAGAPGEARVALTFDDGYADTRDVVWPILRRHRVTGTLFLSTAPPDSGAPLWLDRLRGLFKSTDAEVLDWPERGFRAWPLATTPLRLAAARRLAAALKSAGGAEVEEALGGLALRLGPVPLPPVLSWDDVRRMSAEGLRIGAHTHRHYVLSRLAPAAARDEIAHSVERIESELGRAVESFAYPNGQRGDFDDRSRDVLRELGIAAACTAVPGFARPGDDPLSLPRLPTRAPTLALFACRVAGLTPARTAPRLSSLAPRVS